MVAAVELSELVEEAGGYTVLVVQVDSALDGGIADDVAVREILGDDARPGLLLLCDLVGVAVGDGRGAVILRRSTSRGGDGDVRGAQLCVVQEKGSLGSGVLLCCREGGDVSKTGFLQAGREGAWEL